MSTKDYVTVACRPEIRKNLKMEAARREISVIELMTLMWKEYERSISTRIKNGNDSDRRKADSDEPHVNEANR